MQLADTARRQLALASNRAILGQSWIGHHGRHYWRPLALCFVVGLGEIGMTHYVEDYSALKGLEKVNKALDDIRSFLGEEKFNRVTNELRKDPPPDWDYFRLICSVGGITHYPVLAWYVHAWGLKEFAKHYSEEGQS